MDFLKGEFFEFSAWIRIFDKSGNPATSINPNGEWWRNLSPIVTFNYRQYRDETTKSFMYYAEDRDKAWMARPYKSDGWNLIHGIFRLPETQHLFWEIERAPDNVEFRVDEASLTPFSCYPDELLKNGQLEDSNLSKYWDTWGGDVGLDIVPGFGGAGNALKAFQRPHYSHGQGQVLNMDCVNGEWKCLYISI